jgi:hypothetical protein
MVGIYCSSSFAADVMEREQVVLVPFPLTVGVVPDGCAEALKHNSASLSRNPICRLMERSVLAQWRSLTASGIQLRPPAAGAAAPVVGQRNEEKDWHERIVAHFISVPPFSLPSTNLPLAGPLLLSRQSDGWAEGVARLRWWLTLADGPHSGLSFLDPTVGDEVAREKEVLFSVVLAAISVESRRGEEEWIRSMFGDEWISSRLWARLGRAVHLNKDWLVHLLLKTDRWLHKSRRRDHESVPPPGAVKVLLRDILKSGTPPDVISMASSSSCSSGLSSHISTKGTC